jgi:hypothetical protein
LAIFSTNSTHILYGNSSADWNLVAHSTDTGAKAYSAQTVGLTYFLDDRGAVMTEYAKLRERGGPNGFTEALVTSNTSLHKSVEIIPTSKLLEQAEALRGQASAEVEKLRSERIAQLLARRSEIDSQLADLGAEIPEDPEIPSSSESSLDTDPDNGAGGSDEGNDQAPADSAQTSLV